MPCPCQQVRVQDTVGGKVRGGGGGRGCGWVVKVRGAQAGVGRRENSQIQRRNSPPGTLAWEHPSPWGHRVDTPHRLGGQAVEVHGGHKGPRAARHGVPGPPPGDPCKEFPRTTLLLEPTQRVATKGWVAHPEGGTSPACLKNRPPWGSKLWLPRTAQAGPPQGAQMMQKDPQTSPHVTQLLTGHCRAN